MLDNLSTPYLTEWEKAKRIIFASVPEAVLVLYYSFEDDTPSS